MDNENVVELRPSGHAPTGKDLAAWLRRWADDIEEHDYAKDIVMVMACKAGNVSTMACGNHLSHATAVGLLEFGKMQLLHKHDED